MTRNNSTVSSSTSFNRKILFWLSVAYIGSFIFLCFFFLQPDPQVTQKIQDPTSLYVTNNENSHEKFKEQESTRMQEREVQEKSHNFLDKPKEIKKPVQTNKEKENENINITHKRISGPTYSFDHPVFAEKVLAQLDVFEPVDDSLFGGDNLYDKPFFGLKNDDDYCKKVRAFYVKNTSSIFEQTNFLTTISPKALTRGKVMNGLGNIIMENIGLHMNNSEKEQFLYDFPPDAQIIYSNSSMGRFKHVGKHFACLNQATNNIPGNSALTRKDRKESATIYSKNFQQNATKCFNEKQFFSEVWALNDKERCLDFFDKLNSEEYQKLKAKREVVYVKKASKNIYGYKEIPITSKEEQKLRESFQNGSLCGQETTEIIKEFINPLLHDGHVFNLRSYMLIASTNPLMAFYHDGFARVSLDKYESISSRNEDISPGVFLISKAITIADNQLQNYGVDEETLKNKQQWSFDKLQEHLLTKGVINDTNWLNTYLRPELKKVMIHLIRKASENFFKGSSVYELFEVEFMLDDNFNLYFLDVNSGVSMENYSLSMEKFMLKMLEDHFKVVQGLLRSRMKRAIEYVNRLKEIGLASVGKRSTVVIEDLEERMDEFKIVTQNYFEKEFEPTPDNGFVRIVDENLYGEERYSKLVKEECL